MKKKIKNFGMEVNCETGEVTKVELPDVEIEEVEIVDETAPE
jgi:hypothetical protein